MDGLVAGRAWRFGDNIDTDVLAPGVYMKLPVQDAVRHCLEAVNPDFAAQVRPGDIVVAGRNFGMGSSREQAPLALKMLGVRAVLAKGYGRIFYRNAINLGLPALFFAEADEVSDGDRLGVDPATGLVRNLTSDRTYRIAPIPAHLLEMVEAGGLMPHLEKRLAAQRAAASDGEPDGAIGQDPTPILRRD